jgi:hypothetical protein
LAFEARETPGDKIVNIDEREKRTGRDIATHSMLGPAT